MQQMEALRQRLNPKNEWLRIGLASATIMAPLLKRWTDLRDADSTRALREEAEARWNNARSRLVFSNPFESRRNLVLAAREPAPAPAKEHKNVARIWLIGVSVGLVAAGAAAYFFVQRRMNQALEEPLVDLPVMSSNGHQIPAEAMRAGASVEQPQAAASAGNGATAPAAERPASAPELLMEEQPAETAEMQIERGTSAGVVDAGDAPFIGNIRTMVYHERDDENLPAEENRIYFASEEEARERGYRRDREDVPTAGTEATQETGGTGI